MKKRGWLTLLLTIIMIFDGNIGLTAPARAQDNLPTEQVLQTAGEDAGPAEEEADPEAPELPIGQDGDDHPDASPEENPENAVPEQEAPENTEVEEEAPDVPIPALPDSNVEECTPTEDAYLFVILDPDTGEYRPWDDPTVTAAAAKLYELRFARAAEDGYEILDYPDDLAMSASHLQYFNISRSPDTWYLNVSPSARAVDCWIEFTYRHPDTGQDASHRIWLYVTHTEYAFVIADPETGEYRIWDDPVVPVGEQATYDLYFAKVSEDTLEIQPLRYATYFSSPIPALEQPFRARGGDGVDPGHITINATAPGSYRLEYYGFHAETLQLLEYELWLHVYDYSFVAAQHPGDHYRQWESLGLTVSQGTKAEYPLAFARLVEEVEEVLAFPGDSFTYSGSDEELFGVREKDGQYSLFVDAVRAGSYSLSLRALHPETGELMERELWLHVEPEYTFIIVEREDEAYYSLWDNRTVRMNKKFDYDVHFARVVDGEFEILPLPANISHTSSSESQFYLKFEYEKAYYLYGKPTTPGEYTITIKADHPEGEGQLEWEWKLYVAERSEYFWVFEDPDTGEFIPWDNPTVKVGTAARYEIKYACMFDGKLEVKSFPSSSPWDPDSAEQFNIQKSSSRYYLIINAVEPGSYSLEITAKHPETKEAETSTIWLHVEANEYAFVIQDPATSEYRFWDDPTVRVGQEVKQQVFFAQVNDEGFHILSPPNPLSFDVYADFTLKYEDAEGGGFLKYLYCASAEPGSHHLEIGFTHPETQEKIIQEFFLYVEYEYLFVFADTPQGPYREWDDPIIPVGTTARYALNLARREADGSLHILPEANMYAAGMLSSKVPQVDIERDGRQYYVVINAVQPDDQFFDALSGALNVRHWVHIVENPSGLAFTVVDPGNNSYQVGPGDSAPILARYHNSALDPTQTLRVTARRDGVPVSPEEWTLSDPEGCLELVSQDGESAVYSMRRTIDTVPCSFAADGTTMNLKILPDKNYRLQFLQYDETVPLSQMATMSYNVFLQPGEEFRLGLSSRQLYVSQDVAYTLIDDPYDKITVEGPATVTHTPGDPYITLIPHGTGLIRVRVGYLADQQIWSSAETAQFTIRIGKYNNHNAQGGNSQNWPLYATLRGTVLCEAYGYGESPGGLASLVRSSDPQVVEVVPHASNPALFYCKPTGFGTAVVYLDSDRYGIEMRINVFNEDVPLEAGFADPSALPGSQEEISTGAALLPETDFIGTEDAPFVIPCLTRVGLVDSNSYYPVGGISLPWSVMGYWFGSEATAGNHFTSSDPQVVEIVHRDGGYVYLKPNAPGTCTITYQDGPLRREVVVRSEPNALERVGGGAPGFYTYYGSAQVRRESLSLSTGDLPTLGLLAQEGAQALEKLELGRFSLSDPGVLRVTLAGDDLFSIVPLAQGVVTLTYTTRSAGEFRLRVTVSTSDSTFQFVTEDPSTATGYRIWGEERAMAGEVLEREVFFASVIMGNGEIFSLNLLELPELSISATNPAQFNLTERDGRLYATSSLSGEEDCFLTVSTIPPDTREPQEWEMSLSSSLVVTVNQSTVQAINRAIASAPIQEGRETVILLPSGYIPMDSDVPVLLSRPVTLRGQNTTLNSDIAALSYQPGAKLQDLLIWLDDAAVTISESRAQFTSKYKNAAIFGDGQITLENCTLDGNGFIAVPTAIFLTGNRVNFQGANTIQNFATGWQLESSPGPRRYIRGITFRNISKIAGVSGSGAAVNVVEKGSTDPYFIRLTECNFIDNQINVASSFPVNFSHNYYQGGEDKDHITKWPQYTGWLDPGDDASYPTLRLDSDSLSSSELINFEGRAPIDTENFTAGGGPVTIAVKELLDSYVIEEEYTQTLLQWHFTGALGGTPLFLPSADIDSRFSLPAASGIDHYQGVSFSHHGSLPLEGAEISVRKEVFFQEATLYLYKLADGALIPCGEIANISGEFYTFFLDSCSDYIITNVLVEAGGEASGGGSGGGGSGGWGNQGTGGGQSGSGGTSSSAGDNPGAENPDKTTGAGGHVAANAAPTTPSESAPSAARGAEGTAGEVPSSSPGSSAGGAAAGGAPSVDASSPSAPQNPYGSLPKPITPRARPATANIYLDDATVHRAFADSREDLVVLDVGTKTVVSGLAFQLLQDAPSTTLVLKGDGYTWYFSGYDLLGEDIVPFDTSVFWQPASGGYTSLSFAGTQLPGSAVLELEYLQQGAPVQWLQYRSGRYAPCDLNMRQDGAKLILQLDACGDYLLLWNNASR